MAKNPIEHGPFAGDMDSLTSRENRALYLIAQGRTNKKIAETLNISVNTARAHVQRLLGPVTT